MNDEQATNLAYCLFRLMGSWISRQCYEVNPTYTREALLADIKKNLIYAFEHQKGGGK